MSEIIKKIQKELDIFETKKQELVKELRKDFPQMFNELFEKSKCIKSISWTQYTPYFNDGEECVFSVHTDWMDVNEDDYYNRDGIEGWNKAEEAIITEMKTILASIPEEFYKELFGDHVKVTLSKEGIVVDEYDHE